jgi:hypothetical protein
MAGSSPAMESNKASIRTHDVVTPAKAGVPWSIPVVALRQGMPAFAGMTVSVRIIF